MITERHNELHHNLHANQAGNAEDGTSGAHSSLTLRQLGRFFAATAAVLGLASAALVEHGALPAGRWA